MDAPHDEEVIREAKEQTLPGALEDIYHTEMTMDKGATQKDPTSAVRFNELQCPRSDSEDLRVSI